MDEMNEIRTFGTCECCGNAVTDEHSEYYVTEDGLEFCSIECLLENYKITKIEL